MLTKHRLPIRRILSKCSLQILFQKLEPNEKDDHAYFDSAKFEALGQRFRSYNAHVIFFGLSQAWSLHTVLDAESVCGVKLPNVDAPFILKETQHRLI